MEKKIFFFKEFILTLSNKSSLFSSKKIERCIIFNFLFLFTLIYISVNMVKLSSSDFIQIIVVWLSYGGWNTYQTYRDKKFELNNSNKKE
jgi:hypothetical protein